MHIVDHSSLLCILGYCTYGFRVKQLTLCNPLPQLVTPSPTKPTQKLLTLKAPLLRYSMGPLIALLNGPPLVVTWWYSRGFLSSTLSGLPRTPQPIATLGPLLWVNSGLPLSSSQSLCEHSMGSFVVILNSNSSPVSIQWVPLWLFLTQIAHQWAFNGFLCGYS
jgi:hypothetical protein